MNLADQGLTQDYGCDTRGKKIPLEDHENPALNYFQSIVRKGFFIGKRILSAFARYARLASHEQAVEKESYAFADRPELCRRVRSIVSLQRTKAWNSGRLERWIDGFKTQYSNFPIFQHPTSYGRL